MVIKNVLYEIKEKNKMNIYGIIGLVFFLIENNNWFLGKLEFICFVSLYVFCEFI